jgi:large subunit ribosomal protein L32e
MDAKELLQKRRQLKKKKPEFMKQDTHKKGRLSKSWRKPRGSDSKMRVSRKGYRRIVKVGWGSPSAVKGLDRSGLLPMVINNLTDIQTADPKKHVLVIAGDVGTKKKLVIIEQALSKNLQIANYKEPEKFVAETKQRLEKKKTEKEKVKQEREKKKEAAKKEAEKKKKEEKEKEEKEKAEKAGKGKTEKKAKTEPSEQTEEEKKAEEKKEQDKLLISTQ